MKTLLFYFLLVLVTFGQLCSTTEGLLLTATKHRSNYSSPVRNASESSRVKSTVIYPTLNSPISAAQEGSMYSKAAGHRVPMIFYGFNAATKWIVTFAVSVGVFWNPRHFRGPYIVVGSIAATSLATFLKKVINQGRPDGAPFTDPGMPSSHALVSFFVAMAWNNALSGAGAPWLVGSAIAVSALRVICGYHTIPQIVVGGTLGALLGHAWMSLGILLAKQNHMLTHAASWSAYSIGSTIYVKKNLVWWLTEEKYL